MKFIVGLLIGGGLVFGWYYMHAAAKPELAKADVVIPDLTADKAKIRADYEVQLKAAEDQVESLNKELLKARADLATAQAKITNIVETNNMPLRVDQPANKPVVSVPPLVTVPPKVVQPAPKQTKQSVPAKSGLGGPRPSSAAKAGVVAPPPAGGGVMFNDGQGRSYRIVNGSRIYY